MRVGALIERVPSDQHGHHYRLARAGSHLERRARQAGVRCIVRLAYRVLDPRISVLLRHLSDVDGRFEGFVLAEEELLLAVRIDPVSKQPRSGWSHAQVATNSPQGNTATDVVDQLVLFDPILRPLGFELKLLGAFLLRLGDGHEIRTGSATVNNFICDALVAELEMAVGLVEWRVEDRILDDDLAHLELRGSILHRSNTTRRSGFTRSHGS